MTLIEQQTFLQNRIKELEFELKALACQKITMEITGRIILTRHSIQVNKDILSGVNKILGVK